MARIFKVEQLKVHHSNPDFEKWSVRETYNGKTHFATIAFKTKEEAEAAAKQLINEIGGTLKK